MKALIILGTTRDGRNSVKPAEAVREEFDRQGHETEFFDVKDREIPPLGNRTYVESEKPVPEDVEELSREVESTDVVVIVTPEYNHSVPGPLKNAIDYLYPEYEEMPFSYVTVSEGGFGGIRAVDHLQDITLGLNAHPGPNLPVSRVSENFQDGEPSEEYVEKIEEFVEDSVKFAEKIKGK